MQNDIYFLLLIDRAIRRQLGHLYSLLDNPEWPSNISCDWFVSLSAANQNDSASKRPSRISTISTKVVPVHCRADVITSIQAHCRTARSKMRKND